MASYDQIALTTTEQLEGRMITAFMGVLSARTHLPLQQPS